MSDARPIVPPSFMPQRRKPKLKLPRGACDAHVHVFGPGKRFPYAPGRSATPADAPKETLFALHDFLGVARCVIVHTAAHCTDNSVTADALAANGGG
jgi:2-pyrone-4,6-dicarboxylate lactonase